MMPISNLIRSAGPIAFHYAGAKLGTHFPSLYSQCRNYTASQVYQLVLQIVLCVY